MAATWITQASTVSANAMRWYRVAPGPPVAVVVFSATRVEPSDARADAAAGLVVAACASDARFARSSTNSTNAITYTAMAE
jgi:hypothetical protein